MEPFAPPGLIDESPEDARANLRWVRYARYCLMAIAGINGLLAILVPIGYGAIAYFDPELGPEAAPFMAGVGGLCIAPIILVVGVLPSVAGIIGLNRGQFWGWLVTVVIGAMYAPSACLPVGAFLLYAMLNDEVRKAYAS